MKHGSSIRCELFTFTLGLFALENNDTPREFRGRGKGRYRWKCLPLGIRPHWSLMAH